MTKHARPRLTLVSVQAHATAEGLTLQRNPRHIPGVPLAYTLYQAGAFYADARTLAEAMNKIEARAAQRRGTA